MSRNSGESRHGGRESKGSTSRPLKLRIMDNQVQIACRPGDEDALLEAAAYIDHSMRELRKRNTNSSIEKIAIVTAINTANSLLKARSEQSGPESASTTAGDVATEADDDLGNRLSAMNSKLDELLQPVSTDAFERENSHD